MVNVFFLPFAVLGVTVFRFLLPVAKGLFSSLFYTQLFLSRLLVSDMAILSSAHSSGYSICIESVRTSVLAPNCQLASALPIAQTVSVLSHFSRSAAIVYAYASPFIWRAFVSSPRLSLWPYDGRATIPLHHPSRGEHLSPALD